MSSGVFDVIVIGAGIEGSSTAYYLTSTHTRNVLLLEQFDALHTRGSSHGGSRITRRAYSSSIYVKMMEEAFPMWEEIEKASGKQVYWKTGLIGFDYLGKEGLDSYIDAMQANNLPYELWTGEQANKMYPRQLNVNPTSKCIFEEDGGVLKASVGLRVLQELFVRNGGEFKDCHKVTRIVPGPVVTVETNNGSFKAKKVILATGAWTNELLNSTGLGLDLPLKVYRAEVFYFKVSDPDAFSAAKFPVFLSLHPPVFSTHSVYGTPILEYPGLLKVCQFFNDREIGSPERRDVIPQSLTLDNVTQFIKHHFKGVSTTPSIFELCLYADTPDNNPIIDKHPLHFNIIIAGGFSHGYKMGPVFGKIIGEVALGLPPSYDLSVFEMGRFKIPTASL